MFLITGDNNELFPTLFSSDMAEIICASRGERSVYEGRFFEMGVLFAIDSRIALSLL